MRKQKTEDFLKMAYFFVLGPPQTKHLVVDNHLLSTTKKRWCKRQVVDNLTLNFKL